jgi:hypothetical protein
VLGVGVLNLIPLPQAGWLPNHVNVTRTKDEKGVPFRNKKMGRIKIK